MPLERRKNEPLYINGFTYIQPLPLPIETEKEKIMHKVEHDKKYVFYNKLFGDLKERLRIYYKKRYWS
ncbi:MAG: hypothetical protein K2G60_02105, partial [Oscillospiraceae bacterium]|nr:hypothetical protein [Oscillospiraceae bacterium]